LERSQLPSRFLTVHVLWAKGMFQQSGDGIHSSSPLRLISMFQTEQ